MKANSITVSPHRFPSWKPALWIIWLLLAGCRAGFEPGDALLTAQPSPTAQIAILPSPGLPTPLPTGESLHPPPPGIVYQTAEGVFITTQDGAPRRLGASEAGSEDALPSPDRRYLLRTEAEKQELIEQASGRRISIYPQPGMNLCPFAWVWGQPAVLYTVLLPRGVSPAFTCKVGSPVLFDPQTQAITILDETASGLGAPAISPDGRQIAYTVADRPWLYRFDASAAPFDLERFGWQDAAFHFGDPAWSPDGDSLAWTFQAPEEAGRQGVVVFDQRKGVAQAFTPYEVAGYEAFRPQLLFSPAGRQLVLRHYQAAQGDFASQLFDLESHSSRQLDGFFSQWSPQGSWLLIEKSPAAGDPCRLEVQAPDGALRLPICRGDQAWWRPDDGALLTHPYNREAFWVFDLPSGAMQAVAIPAGAHILGWQMTP